MQIIGTTGVCRGASHHHIEPLAGRPSPGAPRRVPSPGALAGCPLPPSALSRSWRTGLESPFFITLAEQTLRELKELFESQPSFRPMLLLYLPPTDKNGHPNPPTQVISLGDSGQEHWPNLIRRKVIEHDALHWSVATEVSMRYRVTGDEHGERMVRVEEWLVYLLSFNGGMRVWGAPVKSGRKLGRVEDLTADPRMQKMLAHLSEANGLDYN